MKLSDKIRLQVIGEALPDVQKVLIETVYTAAMEVSNDDRMAQSMTMALLRPVQKFLNDPAEYAF